MSRIAVNVSPENRSVDFPNGTSLISFSAHGTATQFTPARQGLRSADLPSEIEGAYPAFHSPEIVATEQGLESAVERIEAEPIPDWLRQSDVHSGECPATAVHRNENSPGPLKRLWTRVTGRTTGSHPASPGQDFWLTDLLERASDEGAKDEQDFAPKQAHIQ